MANINLVIDNATRQVSKNRSFAGVCLENLQDQFIITFSKGFIDGVATMEYQVNGNSYYIAMEKDGESYLLDITQALISEEGVYPFQIRIQQDNSVFKSQIFYLRVYPSLNAIDGTPDYYGWQQWVIDYVDENGGAINVVKRNGIELPIVDKSVDISVPTSTSQLDNDSGFITDANIPSKTSDLVNDSGFITNNALNGYATEQWVENKNYITSADIPNVDQVYNATSTNAQSGTAVAQAVAGLSGGTQLYRHDITMMAMQRSGEVEIHLIYTSTSNVPINTQSLFEQAFNYDKLKLDMCLRDDTNSYISILCIDYNQDGTANSLISMNAGLPITDITSMVSSYSDTITTL